LGVGAVLGYLKDRTARKLQRSESSVKPSFSLEMLVDQVDEALEDASEDDDIRVCGRHLLNYLDDVFLELDDRERTTYEAEGRPGASTTYWCFWANDAKAAARKTLAFILADAKALRG